jgi:hypothetical protein
MVQEARTRTRRRKLAAPPRMEVEEEAAPLAQEVPIAYTEPASAPEVIDTTATVISETVEPLAPEAPPEAPRTDFYFPPLPRSDRDRASRADSINRRPQDARRTAARQRVQQGLRSGARGLKALGRGARQALVGSAAWLRNTFLPILKPIWLWITHDPYAPPREDHKSALLQGRVLGVYRYHRYQRVMLGILGGVPLTISFLYILLTISTTLQGGVNSPLFLVQDLAGATTGFFGSLILLKLATLRITLRSDGIEYKTMFRVVRSRWNEVGVLKVEYFRKSERWVVGTGRGAWAFLHRSWMGLPKGRQLAKLITIYARLSATGTPYWLPALNRFSDTDPIARVEPSEAPQEAQQVPS